MDNENRDQNVDEGHDAEGDAWPPPLRPRRTGYRQTPRFVPRRRNVLEEFSEEDFFRNFGFSKQNFPQVVDIFAADLQKPNNRGTRPLEPGQQIALVLAFLRGGSFHKVAASIVGTSRGGATQILQRVMRVIANQSQDFIFMPTSEELQEFAQKNFEDSERTIPNAPLGVDGTQIRLGRKPKQRDMPSADFPVKKFWCRKGFYSINAQVIADPNGHIRDLDIGWTGATHDAKIWRFSSAKRHWERTQQLREQASQEPFVLLGDKAYPLSRYVLRAYNKKEIKMLYLESLIRKSRKIAQQSQRRRSTQQRQHTTENEETESSENSDDEDTDSDDEQPQAADPQLQAQRSLFNSRLNGRRAICTEDVIGKQRSILYIISLNFYF